MKTTAAVLALVGAVVANPFPQAVTSSIAPKASAPAGCETTYPSTFEISVVNVTSTTTKRSTALMCTLTNGTLTDAEGRTGYIASNYQFQFDKPAQAGAIYTSGWSVCANETLALGGSAVFFQCLSGTFYNLYDESTGNQCNEVYIDVIPIGSSSATAVATESADGQVTASAVATQLTDGQIQATTGVVTQITDGQIQATTGVVTQISDGQIQVTTGVAVVTQISDGQIQATTAAVVSQISDGQIQATKATTAAVVSQISDGQIQATKATTAAPVTQISDGQIQVATSTKGVVSQISDGQIQASASNGTLAFAAVTASSTPLQQTANAAATAGPFFGLAAGVLAVALL